MRIAQGGRPRTGLFLRLDASALLVATTVGTFGFPLRLERMTLIAGIVCCGLLVTSPVLIRFDRGVMAWWRTPRDVTSYPRPLLMTFLFTVCCGAVGYAVTLVSCLRFDARWAVVGTMLDVLSMAVLMVVMAWAEVVRDHVQA